MSASARFDPVAPMLLPLFADLRGRPVLVVGDGSVARRKVGMLLDAGAVVTVGIDQPDAVLQEWIALRRVRRREGTFEPGWLDTVWLVVAASHDPTVNRAVAAAAAARRIFANVVDDADLSGFHVPARVCRGHLQVAISTGGVAPVLARRLRERLEAELDESLAVLTGMLARERPRIRWRFPKPGKRRRFFERLLDGEVLRLLRGGDLAGARAAFEGAFEGAAGAPTQGSVTLVGAGPGDPGLLTLKALRALQEADVILHDRLIGPGILARARRDADCIDVGKDVGQDHAATQSRIHDLMLRHARAGRRVVRLKGGDPLVFGRGGEELDFLRSHAIPCEVVPGITAALACAAAAGIAVTDRRCARAVTLLAARGDAPLDWQALSAARHTLAIYMGVGELATLSRELIRHGRGAETPCALVENGSLPDQRVFTATLADLPALARGRHVRSPALLIVGEVAARVRCATRNLPDHGELMHVTTRAA